MRLLLLLLRRLNWDLLRLCIFIPVSLLPFIPIIRHTENLKLHISVRRKMSFPYKSSRPAVRRLVSRREYKYELFRLETVAERWLGPPLLSPFGYENYDYFILVTFGRRSCDQKSLFVRSFVRSLLFLENRKSDLHEIWRSCSASVPNFTFGFWEIKVKVQGQKAVLKSFSHERRALLWDTFTKFGNPTDYGLP